MIRIEGNIPDITKCKPSLYRLGEYIAFFVEAPPTIAKSQCLKSGMIEYVYALVMVKEANPKEMVLIITSEQTGGIMKAILKSAFKLGDGEGEEPFLCYFNESGEHVNLGASKDWGDKAKFLDKAFQLAFELLNVPKQPVVDLKNKIEMASSTGHRNADQLIPTSENKDISDVEIMKVHSSQWKIRDDVRGGIFKDIFKYENEELIQRVQIHYINERMVSPSGIDPVLDVYLSKQEFSNFYFLYSPKFGIGDGYLLLKIRPIDSENNLGFAVKTTDAKDFSLFDLVKPEDSKQLLQLFATEKDIVCELLGKNAIFAQFIVTNNHGFSSLASVTSR